MALYTQKMKVKVFDIEAGKLISVINEIDARELGLFPLDRIEIFNPKTKKSVHTVVDVTDTMVKENTVGIFEDVQKVLKVRDLDKVEVKAVGRPSSVAFIKKKMEKKRLSFEEIKAIVDDLASNRLSEIEASAFMSAVYINGFDLDETVSMTKALLLNGKQLKIENGPSLDKHSIGGTNGRATMIIVPIIAAAGYYIPKTSSRSITSSSGTADAMEVLCEVALTLEEIKEITERVGGVIVWGGSVDLAPVDDKIIKIEHPLALDPEGQVIASVMAKKASVGAKYVVIDLPVGPDVKVNSKEKAEDMALKFIEVGKKLGIRVECVLTNGTDPCGKAFGPSLEAKYVMEILEGKFFDNLAQKSCELAGALFELVGGTRKGEGYEKAKKILESGKALKKMKEIIKAQHGKIFNSEDIKSARFKKEVKSYRSGEITSINVRLLNDIARIAGAPADKRAGVMLKVETHQQVRERTGLFEIHAENKRKLELAESYAKRNESVKLEKVVLEKFT